MRAVLAVLLAAVLFTLAIVLRVGIPVAILYLAYSLTFGANGDGKGTVGVLKNKVEEVVE
jgi:NhaP-type Na+/H+ and K+/H+ antiporter